MQSKEKKVGHYAILDENNIVTMVFVGKDEGDLGPDGKVWDWEEYYKAKRTSYNTVGGVHRGGGAPFRKNYAGIGFRYDPDRDAFIPPQPFESWTLNEETCLWEPPVPMPESGPHNWNEQTLSWEPLSFEDQ
jgi:hypothetical protein